MKNFRPILEMEAAVIVDKGWRQSGKGAIFTKLNSYNGK